MRGKLISHLRFLLDERIIPAHAGQTLGSVFYEGCSTDHPRACGANNYTADDWRQLYGSSPRMRGKPSLIARR